MLQFGGAITLNGLVVYIAYNLEKVLLGRFWGAEVVGIYGRAYQLINIPTDNLNSAAGGVAFAALSRVQNDPQRLRSYFLKGYSLIAGADPAAHYRLRAFCGRPDPRPAGPQVERSGPHLSAFVAYHPDLCVDQPYGLALILDRKGGPESQGGPGSQSAGHLGIPDRPAIRPHRRGIGLLVGHGAVGASAYCVVRARDRRVPSGCHGRDAAGRSCQGWWPQPFLTRSNTTMGICLRRS